MIPVLGFTPDQDPTTPGVLVDVEQQVPTEIGMRASPLPVDVGNPALSSEARGAVVTRNLSGNRRLIVGTEDSLFDAGSGTWNDVSARTYALGADDRWSFAQFGNATIAATLTEPLQRSVSGTFADITAAPNAKLVESVKGFVVAFHTSETNFGDSPDRWWCSALLDETDWVPNVSTQCTTGRLIEGGGAILAAKRLGEDLVAYKQRALFLGRYSGPPEVWNWTQISSEIGCVGQDAVVDIGVAHVFVGEDDIYIYDGVRPVSIATNKVRQWFVDNRDPVYQYKTQVLWDRQNSLAWIFFASNTSVGVVDSGLVWHSKSGKWGKVAHNVSAVVNYISPSITYDGGTPLVTTYDSGPLIPYDSPFWISGTELPAIIETDEILKTLSGTPTTSSFTTGDLGDEDFYSMATSFKVRYKRSPSSATATGYTKDDGGSLTLVTVSSALRDDGAFDVRQSGRWHRFRVESTGACEYQAVRMTSKEVGRR